tara:strand:- start:82 stop:462 length:381 start_codon:yes stop_codon:yes gene_type:complete
MALETIRESRTAKTVGTRTKNKKEKGVIFKLERLYDEATDIAASTGEVILDVYNRLKKKMNLSEGGMPHKRKNNDVPKGFHKMPDGSIMKDKKMSTTKNYRKGGIISKDYRKGGMVINTTNNKRNT